MRAVLGQTGMADGKLEHGMWFKILGVEVRMSADCYWLRPARNKAEVCMAVIRAALETGITKSRFPVE